MGTSRRDGIGRQAFGPEIRWIGLSMDRSDPDGPISAVYPQNARPLSALSGRAKL